MEVLEPEKGDQPIYEIIKREDLIAAFTIALERALKEVLARIDEFIDIYTSIEVSALWIWDYSSRWDYDMWW